MAYRNTIISLASVVALGTACSKAPSYNSSVQAGSVDQQSDDALAKINAEGHAPDNATGSNTTASTEPKKEDTTTPAPATPAAPAAGNNTPAATAPKTDAEKAKIIATNGYAAYAVAAPNGQGWNTAATPFLIGQTVNAAGAVDTAKPVNVYFCNFQGANVGMTLHSGDGNNQGPMKHGNQFMGVALGAGETVASKQAALDAAIAKDPVQALTDIKAMTNCRAHLVTALGTTAGATYNHQGGSGNAQASFVYFKMFTVDAAGVVTAK